MNSPTHTFDLLFTEADDTTLSMFLLQADDADDLPDLLTRLIEQQRELGGVRDIVKG